MCVGQLRNLHTPIGIVTSLYYSHSLGEFIPGLLSHLSLSLSSKASPPHLWPPGCFFPKNCFIFRRSTTNSQLNACTFSAGGPNCGRESFLCFFLLRESNTKLLFPSASSGEETGKIPPSVSLFLFLSLLVSITFWASRTHTMHTHTHTVQPTLSKSSLGLHIALFCGLLRAWLHALFIPQAYSFHQCRRN